MDFHQARRMWEEAAASPSAAPARPTSPPVPTPAPAPAPAASASASASTAQPSAAVAAVAAASPLHPHPHDMSAAASDPSDYSDVGDYSADEDFYVPGVNDPPPSIPPALSALSHPPPADRSAAADRYPSSATSSSPSASASASFASASHTSSAHSSHVVRQDSNFSRLSAQSWLTVDSAQEVDAPLPPPRPPAPPRSGTPAAAAATAAAATVPRDAPIIPDRKFPAADRDHDPVTLFDVDPQAELLQRIQAKPLSHMSVFECCAVLQAGVPAYKKKSFRRFGARRVWLSPDCDLLLWTSKKDGVTSDHIKLQKVAKMRCVDREVSVDVTEGYRISLLFANAEEAGMWVKALSCLIPLQARVRAPRDVVPIDKEREDYTLIDDVFDNSPLRDRIAVNSYIVLCSANKQPPQMGSKLAFSRSDSSFCGLRYIPYKLVPLLLRSQEEIAVLKRLKHDNVVKYHECLQDQEHGGNYVIFEYLAKGSIMDSTRLEGVQPIAEATAREYIRDVVNGLEYLHSLRIVHGDVRPDNLLRSVDGAIKINPLGCITHDFTEIKNVPPLVRARLGDASPAFLAPELCWLSDAPPAHSKSYAMDVWAVGVVLYFMLYGRVPFGGRDDYAIQESICKGRLRFPRHPETSRKVRGLLKGVLGEKDPKTRIALSELQRHPWFSEADNGAPVAAEARREPTRLIVSPEEIDSAVQVAKVGVNSRKR